MRSAELGLRGNCRLLSDCLQSVSDQYRDESESRRALAICQWQLDCLLAGWSHVVGMSQAERDACWGRRVSLPVTTSRWVVQALASASGDRLN